MRGGNGRLKTPGNAFSPRWTALSLAVVAAARFFAKTSKSKFGWVLTHPAIVNLLSLLRSSSQSFKMHGIKRVRQTREALEAKAAKEQAQIKKYLALTEDILSRKKNHDWSKDALELTTQMLQINPEFYTVWNYRRNILTKGIFPESSPEEINNLLSEDLSMTTDALKLQPKVYWIWNHRRWCLENVPDGPGDDPAGWKKSNWKRELFVVEKMLDIDARNCKRRIVSFFSA
jgi:hypothetical protein